MRNEENNWGRRRKKTRSRRRRKNMAVTGGGNKEWVRGEGESELWKEKERIGVGEGSRWVRRSS